MNLILFKRSEISKDGKSIELKNKDPRTKHIFGHLRKVDGDSVTIGIISGFQGKAIARTTSAERRLEFDASLLTDDTDDGCTIGSRSSSHEIVLVLSLPFPKRLKTLWAQITSMGVTRICIVRGMLSDANYCKSSTITPGVYRPLVEEGMSQGCHTKEVAVDIEVEEVLSQAVLDKLGLTAAKTTTSTKTSSCDDGEIKIFLDCGDETTIQPLPLRQAIMKKMATTTCTSTVLSDRNKTKCVILAIGSERGWTDDEATFFHEAGFESASLGRSILRVDTAVIAGLGIVSATLDELEHEDEQKKKQNHVVAQDRTLDDDSSRKRKQDI